MEIVSKSFLESERKAKEDYANQVKVLLSQAQPKVNVATYEECPYERFADKNECPKLDPENQMKVTRGWVEKWSKIFPKHTESREKTIVPTIKSMLSDLGIGVKDE